MMREAPALTAGDEQFKQELARTLPHLRAFARGLSGHAELADDLVQETAIKAWAAREQFIPGTNMRAWTFAILRNFYLSELRRKRHQADYDPEAAERLLVVDADQENGLHLSDMEEALRELSPERREALLLIGASGFTYEEAAAISNCAIGTMKSRVARGRAELAKLLDPDIEGGEAAALRKTTRASRTGSPNDGILWQRRKG